MKYLKVLRRQSETRRVLVSINHGDAVRRYRYLVTSICGKSLKLREKKASLL